jgi:membrane peptidoglycan carboxypeptidase
MAETWGPEDLERRPFPRSFQEWRARIRDAWTFGDRVAPPLPRGPELMFRIGVLAVVTALTGILFAMAASPAAAFFGRTVGLVASRFDQPLPEAKLPKFDQRSVVLDRNGRTLATFSGEENRVFLSLSDIPLVTQQAVIAIEDARFYQHHGVDVPGLLRAMFLNIRVGGIAQGGSTITQQLVKNTIVGRERSLDRKVREARLAVELEKRMSKQKILEAYLNETYFGNGVYGVETAAQFYFGEHARDLTMPQSALLAAIIKAPQNYEPIHNYSAARGRRDVVMRRMSEEGFITRDQFEAARAKGLGVKAHTLRQSSAPFLLTYIRNLLRNDPKMKDAYDDPEAALYTAGLRIQTTLDASLLQSANDAMARVLPATHDPAAALVSIDPATGGVRAVAQLNDVRHTGGEDTVLALAFGQGRQPGSTFKPLTLLAAITRGISPALTFNGQSPYDGDVCGQHYKVPNYDNEQFGFLNMRQATEKSVNTYYVQLENLVGCNAVVDMGRALGIQSDLSAIPSLTLGTIDVTPYELASAYATLANGGVRCKPFLIEKITATGKTIVDRKPDCERTVDANAVALADDILRGVIARGTGRKNGNIGRPAAGKTGTTNDYTNSWFAGFTPQFATTVWLGYPDDQKTCLCNLHGLKKVFGGSLPAMIWSRYMRFAHQGLSVKGFPAARAPGLVAMVDVVGKTNGDARKMLADAGFPSVEAHGVDSPLPFGTVVAQDPPAGTRIAKGSLVTLQISNGKGPKPTPTPKPKPKPSPTPKPSPKPSKSPTPTQ